VDGFDIYPRSALRDLRT